MDYENMTLEQLADEALAVGYKPPAEWVDARKYYIECLKEYEHAVERPMEHELGE